MTFRTLPAALLAALTLAVGCAGDHADHAAAPPEVHADHKAAPAGVHAEDTAPASHATHAAPAGLALTLNEGAKWSMDEHTRTSSAALHTHLGEATPDSVEAMTALGATLQGDIDGLIAGCKMTGPSHDQLHVFLMAFIPEVQALSGTTDLAAGHENVARLKGLMASYSEHFE